MSEKRKVLQLLREGKVTVDKAENLLNQLSLKKEIEKYIHVEVIGSDGEMAKFSLPLSIVSMFKGNIISIDSLHTIKDILKEINFDKLLSEIERKVTGEVANIRTERGDQLIVKIK